MKPLIKEASLLQNVWRYLYFGFYVEGYINYICVKSSNIKNGLRNTKNIQIPDWVIMGISNEVKQVMLYLMHLPRSYEKNHVH